MFAKIRTSKSTPGKALRYICDKNIMPEAMRRNLYSSTLSPEKEMMKTAERFGKWRKPDERKTLSIIISPNPADNPNQEQLLDITNAVLDRFFSTIQGVVVVHRDKPGTADSKKARPVLHSHFEGSIIDPTTGKNIHFSSGKIREIQKWADHYAQEKYDWMPFRPTKEKLNHNRYRVAAKKAIAERGTYSWTTDMATQIERCLDLSESHQDFINGLKTKGIEVINGYRNKKTGDIVRLQELRFSTRYKGKLMVVKGSTLSENLAPSVLKKRYPELGDNNGQIRRFTNKNCTPKSKWVQDILADSQQERTVGKDISESLEEKSTSNASSAQETKQYAKNAQDLNKQEEEKSNMEEMKDLAKLINRTVEASLSKTQKQINDLENGYIRRNNALLIEITGLKAQVMCFEREKEQYEETKKLNKLLKKILFWTYGSIVGIIFIILLLLYLGWI